MNSLHGCRIVIADGHPLILAGLAALLEREGAIVVAACATGEEALRAARAPEVDLVLIDADAAGFDGAALLEALGDQTVSAKVVLSTSSRTDAPFFGAAAAAGAYCACSKQDADSVLHCLRVVAGGGRCFPAQPAPAPQATLAGGGTPLTAREAEVAGLVNKGLSNRQIALRLAISEGTVKVHLHNIFGKLGVANRTALAISMD